jgi:uncharacterized protein YabE (DUF348 family)
VEVGEHDLVEPAPDRELAAASVVTVRRVEIVEDVVDVTIEPDEQRPTTDDLPTGEEQVEAGRGGTAARDLRGHARRRRGG